MIQAPNPRALWDRAKALQREERWAAMLPLLIRAEAAAPDHANYFFLHGYALIKLAETEPEPRVQSDTYTEAIPILRRCIAIDPNVDECRFFLAEAVLAKGEPQTALDEYARAIRLDPTVGYYYPPLVDLLVALKRYDDALGVAKIGVQQIGDSTRAKSSAYALHVLSFMAFQGKGDSAGMLRALEQAHVVGGDEHPEILFNLGSTYAVQKPPNRDKARELLIQFVKRVCKGTKAALYKDQCEASQSLLQKLGTTKR